MILTFDIMLKEGSTTESGNFKSPALCPTVAPPQEHSEETGVTLFSRVHLDAVPPSGSARKDTAPTAV